MASAVKFERVSKSFGKVKVLHDIDLQVGAGEFVVLVGPSGCGKSTALRLLAGLEEITSGDVLIDGVRVNDMPPARRGIAMVFQSYALYPHMNVYENMAFGLRLAHAPKAEIDAKVHRAADILQLDPLLDRLPKQLSGGQRQRVAIGRAIVREPKVFLFDEPLSNLDAALRVQTRIEIAKLHTDLSATIIYVTHDQVEAMTLADRIVVMNDGRVEQMGTPLELYHRPQNTFVAGFIGSPAINLLQGSVSSVDGDRVTVVLDGGGTAQARVEAPADAVGQKVSLGIRPESLRVSSGGNGLLQGELELVEQLGEFCLMYVTHGDSRRVVAKLEGCVQMVSGTSVSLSAAAGELHLFDEQGRAWRRLEVPDAV